jgi:hypothetical protein
VKSHNNETHTKDKLTVTWRITSLYNETEKCNINEIQEACAQIECKNIYLTVPNSFSPLAGSINLKIKINTKPDNL